MSKGLRGREGDEDKAAESGSRMGGTARQQIFLATRYKIRRAVSEPKGRTPALQRRRRKGWIKKEWMKAEAKEASQNRTYLL